MAAKDGELSKHTLNLFKGDFDKVGRIYPNLGAGVVIRQIVRNFIINTEAANETDIKTEVNL